VAQRLKDFRALPEELVKLTPEQLGEKLALLPAQAAKDSKGAQAARSRSTWRAIFAEKRARPASQRPEPPPPASAEVQA
jgi:lipase chaperone LimK